MPVNLDERRTALELQQLEVEIAGIKVDLRWTTYDAARWGTERPANVPAAIQERAYTSPIWYRPPSGAKERPGG